MLQWQKISFIRTLTALASIHGLYIHQLDVKTTFLNGDLQEKIHMKQLDCFVLLGNEKTLRKLVNTLYGLKQTFKQCPEKFDKAILVDGFIHNNTDKCIYS